MMELVGVKDGDLVSQSFSMCGGTVYTGKDAVYFAMIRCNSTGNYFGVYDYIFVQNALSDDVFLAKIHSIYIETKTNSLCMEVQYFPVARELQAPSEPNEESSDELVVMEITQTLELKQVDLATVLIKPVCAMFVPGHVKDDDLRAYVIENTAMYREHRPSGVRTADEDDVDMDSSQGSSQYEGSFIASEGTPSVYDDSSASEQIADDSTASVSARSSIEIHENNVYFFYNKLALNVSAVYEASHEVVPAIEPVLLDLLWSYTSDIRDTTGDVYEALVGYVSQMYFNGVSAETLMQVKDERFLRLKAMVDKAIEAGDGGLVNPYHFFATLTS